MTASGTSSIGGGALATELRRCETRARHLRSLVRDTRRALRDVADVRPIEAWAQSGVCEVGNIAARAPALVILGRCATARARLTNALLADKVLPTDDHAGGWRWIRLQYGICKQVRLSLGNSEFEVVETLQCNQKSWDIIPLEDLQRRDDSDLVTILDIELNSPILKEGLVILIPPDYGPNTSIKHDDYYSKRDSILNSYTPIYLFALDRLGKIKTCKKNHNISETKSTNRYMENNTDVFCSVDNMYYLNRILKPYDSDNKENVGVLRNCDIGLGLGLMESDKCDSCCSCKQLEKRNSADKNVLETSVLSEENLHDIQMANGPYNNSHILFVLFSNSPEHQNISLCQEDKKILNNSEETELGKKLEEEKKKSKEENNISENDNRIVPIESILQTNQTFLPLDHNILQNYENNLNEDHDNSENEPILERNNKFDRIFSHHSTISYQELTNLPPKTTNTNQNNIILDIEPTTMHQELVITSHKSTLPQEQHHLNSTNKLTPSTNIPTNYLQEHRTMHQKPTTPMYDLTVSNEQSTTLHNTPTIFNEKPVSMNLERVIKHHNQTCTQNEPTIQDSSIPPQDPSISLLDRTMCPKKRQTEATESKKNHTIDMFNELPECEKSRSNSPKVILSDKLESVVKNGDFVRDGGGRRSKKRKGKPSSAAGLSSNGEKPFDHKRDFMINLIEQLEVCSNITANQFFKGSWIILDDDKVIERKRQRQNPLNIFKTKTEPTTHLRKLSTSTQKIGGSVNSDSCQNESSDLTEEWCVVSVHDKLYSLLTKFVSKTLKSNLLENCTRLSEIHTSLLQQFILASFDMAREIQVVPKKIQYVAVTEQHLYDTLTEKFAGGEKKEELLQMMQKVLYDMRNTINNTDWRIDDLQCHQETDLNSTYNSVFYCPTPLTRVPSCRSTLYEGSINSSLVTGCTHNDTEEAISFDNFSFDDYDIICSEELLNSETSETKGSSINEERPTTIESSSTTDLLIPNGIEASEECYNPQSESVIRILSLGHESVGDTNSRCRTRSSEVSIKQASLEVQKLVLENLSNNISEQLVEFVDCLRETYFGTLQRCIESLEESCREELGSRPAEATEAVRQVLSAARAVDLAGCASFSMLRTLVEHLRRFFYKLKVVGGGGVGEACCVKSPRWRRQVALQTLHSLSAARLARIISMQIRERLRTSHERYQAALTSLEVALAGRLHHTEDVKLSVRKRYAPGFARLCLESTSMCDLLKYGVPEMGREIGRGQYGVVFSCTAPWGGHEPCAVKSVLPADDRHYNELAMEFFYTRSIPAHPRIVRLWGSVVERHPGGCSPTVLLVSERLIRDLYCAIRTGDLCRTQRMQIAVDIVQGIRYLHSLGLVHRDITKKNVLLDRSHRAKLTDLGFCVPEALMSGSVVGTPIHMAPELLTGEYDSSVDVYAFGILFWYLCAGHAHLPTAFEVFKNKEQLWSRVRKGLRPERLSQFSDQAWNLMESCWAGEPALRPLLGDVQPILEQIMADSEQEQNLSNTLSEDEDIPRQKQLSPDELSMVWSRN